MDPINSCDPPDHTFKGSNAGRGSDRNGIEMSPFIRGGDPESNPNIRIPSSRSPRHATARGNPRATASSIGAGRSKAAVSRLLNVLAPLENTLQDRKKSFLLLLSTLFVALVIMISVKHKAVDIESNVGAGDHTAVRHPNLPPEVKQVIAEPVTDNADAVAATEEAPAEGSVAAVEETPAANQVSSGSDAAPPPEPHIVNTEGYESKELRTPTFFVPGTEDAAVGSSAGGGFNDYPTTNHFQHNHPEVPSAKSWGWFAFEDPDPKWRGKPRPQPDFASVEHRDVKGSDFPEGAWQKDAAYMKQFLYEAKKLVNRTMESIFAEYGVGIPPDGSIELTDEQLVQREEFAPYVVLDNYDDPDDPANKEATGKQWTTKQSLDGLSRRLIHAIMTGDTFKMVLGGHSAAAGHGNNFNQGYMIKAGEALEPVFAHLGVELRAYNLAQGGMGTFQQALAGMDLRGKETDFIMWDSSMTEKAGQLFVFFMKQALISGNRAPFLFGDGRDMRNFHKIAGADVGEHGGGWSGPVTNDDVQALQVPWAARYLNCDREKADICKKHEYNSGCWIDRDDFTPTTPQNAAVGGTASWHPGNRIHKIRGRRIALFVLRGLAYALERWEELTAEKGHPLADEHWHVADYYKDIREKAPDVPGCYDDNFWKIGQKRRRGLRTEGVNTTNQFHRRDLDTNVEGIWPSRLCNIPLQGRSGWGPRANTMETSLLSIIKPNAMGDKDPNRNNIYMTPPLYLPPELPMPWDIPPENEVYVEQIASARRLDVFGHQHSPQRKDRIISTMAYNGGKSFNWDQQSASTTNLNNTTRNLAESIVPGYGVSVNWGRSGYCDGTSHSWCEKTDSNKCLLGGTQDNRGNVCFDGLSGWVIFEIKNVKAGFIGARLEAWHGKEAYPTEGWTEVNNGGKGNYDRRDRLLHEETQKKRQLEFLERMEREIEEDILVEDPSQRRLGGGQSCGFTDDYTFEFAINGGQITTWNKAQFCEHYTRVAYNLDVLKFMDDESKTGDFELAMRITNAGREESMCISHLWWA